jgi:hypothetical protein
MFGGVAGRRTTPFYAPSMAELPAPLDPIGAARLVPSSAPRRRRVCREIRTITPHTFALLAEHYGELRTAERRGGAALLAARRLWQRLMGGAES